MDMATRHDPEEPGGASSFSGPGETVRFPPAEPPPKTMTRAQRPQLGSQLSALCPPSSTHLPPFPPGAAGRTGTVTQESGRQGACPPFPPPSLPRPSLHIRAGVWAGGRAGASLGCHRGPSHLTFIWAPAKGILPAGQTLHVDSYWRRREQERPPQPCDPARRVQGLSPPSSAGLRGPEKLFHLLGSPSRPGIAGLWCLQRQCPFGKSKAAGWVEPSLHQCRQTTCFPRHLPGRAADLSPNFRAGLTLLSLALRPTPRNNLTKSPGRKTPSKWDKGPFPGWLCPLPLSSISDLLPISQ
ncbi:uncharacterized protein LOC102152383 [Canis lupus familiaris]|uniref:uncharacterized protein LOC102152383 n=1 Tax=Canis lupus familiaris TaxID=9615 RepID=UPI000BA9FD83|nr:uncharacterized protein LOC102152383 [Canis lupus familiaris]|eukprot:XP_022264969.1 uncharacterized protein LOC102152383 [Canis lupus familiaris]